MLIEQEVRWLSRENIIIFYLMLRCLLEKSRLVHLCGGQSESHKAASFFQGMAAFIYYKYPA